MPDIIGALTNKKSALLAQRRKIRETADKKIEDINLEIAKVDEAITVINGVLEGIYCPQCHGSGSVRHCDAAGSMEDIDCPTCHGTGVQYQIGRASCRERGRGDKLK